MSQPLTREEKGKGRATFPPSAEDTSPTPRPSPSTSSASRQPHRDHRPPRRGSSSRVPNYSYPSRVIGVTQHLSNVVSTPTETDDQGNNAIASHRLAPRPSAGRTAAISLPRQEDGVPMPPRRRHRSTDTARPSHPTTHQRRSSTVERQSSSPTSIPERDLRRQDTGNINPVVDRTCSRDQLRPPDSAGRISARSRRNHGNQSTSSPAPQTPSEKLRMAAPVSSPSQNAEVPAPRRRSCDLKGYRTRGKSGFHGTLSFVGRYVLPPHPTLPSNRPVGPPVPDAGARRRELECERAIIRKVRIGSLAILVVGFLIVGILVRQTAVAATGVCSGISACCALLIALQVWMQRRQLQINEGHAAADIKEKKRQKIYRIKNYVVVPITALQIIGIVILAVGLFRFHWFKLPWSNGITVALVVLAFILTFPNALFTFWYNYEDRRWRGALTHPSSLGRDLLHLKRRLALLYSINSPGSNSDWEIAEAYDLSRDARRQRRRDRQRLLSSGDDSDSTDYSRVNSSSS